MHAHTGEGAALVVSQFHVRHVFIGSFESTALIVEDDRFDYGECRKGDAHPSLAGEIVLFSVLLHPGDSNQ